MKSDYGCEYGIETNLIERRACWGWVYKIIGIKKYFFIDITKSNFSTDTDDLLINIIDEITPCQRINEKSNIICFYLLDTYDQNLILLNFIRNLWHEQSGCNEYCANFFKILKELYKENKIKDPLEILTTANSLALKDYKNIYTDHSNCVSRAKVKTTMELKSFKGTSTQTFLQF